MSQTEIDKAIKLAEALAKVAGNSRTAPYYIDRAETLKVEQDGKCFG